MTNATRPYGAAELAAYLTRIGLLPRIDARELRHQLEHDPLGSIGMMMRAHMERIPFENTFIHFGRPPQSPDLDPTSLHARFTSQKLGGYCFFHSLNTCNVLAGLAVLPEVTSSDTGHQKSQSSWTISSARPVLGVVCVGKDQDSGRPKFESTGRPTHCVCLVTLLRGSERQDLIVDVGFGRKGPIGPVLFPSKSLSTCGPITSHPSLRGEEWRIRRPAEGELPPPREGLEQEWLFGHPLSNKPGEEGYIMEHRLVGTDQDGQVAGEWETLYAFSTHERTDLESFQGLSDDVFKGQEEFTTKFRDHLTCSRVYRVGAGQADPLRLVGEVPDSEAGGLRLARLALTDMEVSSFETTAAGTGQKDKVKRFESEEERKKGLEEWFGLSV